MSNTQVSAVRVVADPNRPGEYLEMSATPPSDVSVTPAGDRQSFGHVVSGSVLTAQTNSVGSVVSESHMLSASTRDDLPAATGVNSLAGPSGVRGLPVSEYGPQATITLDIDGNTVTSTVGSLISAGLLRRSGDVFEVVGGSAPESASEAADGVVGAVTGVVGAPVPDALTAAATAEREALAAPEPAGPQQATLDDSTAHFVADVEAALPTNGLAALANEYISSGDISGVAIENLANTLGQVPEDTQQSVAAFVAELETSVFDAIAREGVDPTALAELASDQAAVKDQWDAALRTAITTRDVSGFVQMARERVSSFGSNHLSDAELVAAGLTVETVAGRRYAVSSDGTRMDLAKTPLSTLNGLGVNAQQPTASGALQVFDFPGREPLHYYGQADTFTPFAPLAEHERAVQDVINRYGRGEMTKARAVFQAYLHGALLDRIENITHA